MGSTTKRGYYYPDGNDTVSLFPDQHRVNAMTKIDTDMNTALNRTSALEFRIAELESGPRSTGARDITSMSEVEDITKGQIVVWRVGGTVTLSINQIVFGEGTGGWARVLRLPAGFRPLFDCRESLLSADSGHQLTLYKSGSLYLNKSSDYAYRNTISFATDETWPSSLPGEPA